MKNTLICDSCGNQFRMGYDGTADGCDACTGNIRDENGYIYEPDVAFIVLEDTETGEQKVRQRPIVGRA